VTLAQLRKYALSLAGSTEEPHFERTSFRVGGKIFATAKPDEPHVHVFVGEDVREPALAAHGDCMEKLPWGGKIVGLRVHLTAAPAAVVKELVRAAWQARAPGAKSKLPAPTTGYSGTPLAKKLGIGAGTQVHVIDEPANYQALLAPLPAKVAFTDRISQQVDVVHLFVRQRALLQKQLIALRRKLRPDAALWISWPKKAAKQPTDITEDGIREVALPLGLVDIKVCAVDPTWSGLKLVIRKELR
jgi:hypothetical protein